ncbi:GTPase NRas-like isoform X2 [Macrotis lagotis]
MAYKLVVVGSPGAGKSALIIRFLENRFLEVYEPTVNHSYEGQLVVDGETCELRIMDTSGGDEYPELWEDCVRWGQGFLFVYTVECIRSFVDMTIFWHRVRRVKGAIRVPMVLVANKVDEVHRMVDSDMGQEAARSFGVPFVETSAKTGQGVEQAIQKLVRQIVPQGYSYKSCTIQ